MTDPQPSQHLSRRHLLRGAGALAAGSALAPALVRPAAAAEPGEGRRSPGFAPQPDRRGTVPVEGLHLQFGADPATEMVASWKTLGSVHRPRLQLGTPDGGFGRVIAAETRTYTDPLQGIEVQTHHARMTGLHPDADYLYAVTHDGARAEMGSFRTAPAGRRPFTFTSFGDQATPYLTGPTPPPTGPLPPGTVLPPFRSDALGAPASGDIVDAIETVRPLFHLVNGDLCYANLSATPTRVWDDFFANNTRSARWRPWMPTAGNHENEKGNGPLGFSAYQTRFALPGNGQAGELAGLWYAFTVGSVRVVCIQNDDVAYQDGGGSYIHGYSGGAQRRWLEQELAAARLDRRIDWVVVCMHQVVISTVDQFNGADLGIRQQFAPLFDRYGVDLVVCGHEHHYERSHPVRGVVSGSETLTPHPVATGTATVDTSAGTVHMVLGGGGTSVPSNKLFFDPPRCRVITKVTAPGPNGKRSPVYVTEDAPWSAVRNRQHAYGFAAFDVDPGSTPGGTTTMTVTYYDVLGPGQIAPFETFTLRRDRSDGPRRD